MTKKLLGYVLTGTAAITLSACTTFHEPQLTVTEDTEIAGATTYAVADTPQFEGYELASKKAKADARNVATFYFDYDQYSVPLADQNALLVHAQYLKTHPTAHIRLEGHADERGSREYNITLGKRRADAVKQFLVTHGAANMQVDVVSFGKEKPIEVGHNEHAWQKNRRAHIVYERS